MEQIFNIDDASPCNACARLVPLSMEVCPECNEEQRRRFTALEVYAALYGGDIIDARAGGLVIGRNHHEDDIPMISVVAVGIFQVCGVMMGGEYIVNHRASSMHRDRLLEINSSVNSTQLGPIPSFALDEKCRVFNVNGHDGDLILLIDNGAFVVNRAATQRHYSELVDLNSSAGASAS